MSTEITWRAVLRILAPLSTVIVVLAPTAAHATETATEGPLIMGVVGSLLGGLALAVGVVAFSRDRTPDA